MFAPRSFGPLCHSAMVSGDESFLIGTGSGGGRHPALVTRITGAMYRRSDRATPEAGLFATALERSAFRMIACGAELRTGFPLLRVCTPVTAGALAPDRPTGATGH